MMRIILAIGGLRIHPDQVISGRSSLVASLNGGLVALAFLVLARELAGTQLLAELAVDASTQGLQPRGFSFLISTLGALGKPLLFASVLAGQLLLFLLVWRLAWRAGLQTPQTVALTAFAVFLILASLTFLVDLVSVARLASSTSWAEYLLANGLACGVFALVSLVSVLPASPLPTQAEESRRQLLTALPGLALALAATAVLGRQVLRAAGGGVQVSYAGKETPEVTPTEDFYVVSKNLIDPRVDADRWRLRIGGLTRQMVTLTYADVLAMPSLEQYTTLQCISNEVGGYLMSNALWTGFSLRSLLEKAGPLPEARYVMFRSQDDYTESMPLGFALQDGVILAHSMNGVRLPHKHGFPLRLLAPGKYGVKNPKWITEIMLADREMLGYWQQRDWDKDAEMNTSCRIDMPAHFEVIDERSYRLRGVAFSGRRGISKVEVSVDGGRSWREAVVKPALSPYTWLLWHYDWTDLPAPASLEIYARASDGEGVVQTAAKAPPYPSGATGYPRVPARLE